MFPPHLPPPTCDVKRHQQWQRIKTILFSTFFGLIAGLSGASVMIGWIWPTVSTDWVSTRYPSTISREQLQNRAENKIADKVYTIFKKSNLIGSARYFSPEDTVSDGVMSVTSGWLVTYIPNFDGKTKDWVAVQQNGSVYKIDKALSDSKTGFVFLKIVPMGTKSVLGDQFKVATFNTEIKTFDNVYVYEDGRWLSTAVTGKVAAFSDSHLDTVAPTAFVLNDPFRNGSVVIDKDGNVIGFVTNKSIVRPLFSASYFLNGIEDRAKLVYPSLGVEGWYSEEKTLVIDEEITTGFIVMKANANRNVFQRGDIILQINGRDADWNSMWYTIISNNKANVKLLRAGKVIEKEVSIIQL